MTVTFSPTPVDADIASALLAEYFADRAASFPPEMGEYRPATASPEQFAPPAGVFVVALDGDEPLGCGGVRRIDAADGIRFEVKHLFVRPNGRGRGLGRGLLADLEQRAIELGATEMVLDTNRVLAAAGGLYASMGYRAIEPYNDNGNATDWYGKQI